ncbi:MAG: carboxypeptidase Q, partial [Myxococcota bacterium]
YRETAQTIIASGRSANGAWSKMQELCDDIGHRLSGSKGLERAVAWAIKTMKADGHQNVAGEEVMVPRWVRGKESAALVVPYAMDFSMLGLGGSVGTPAKGITASVVVVTHEEELEARGKAGALKGKIVLFNNAMPEYDAHKHGSHYGHTVRFRVRGADQASAHGAVAVLVRSVTAVSLNTPHTGAMRYSGDVKKIPAAAVAVEAATLLARLAARGRDVKVQLKMQAKDHGMVLSHNVVGELRGSEKPDEIVVISGHLDSWDVGSGAHDDASGCIMAMEALTLLRKLKLRPRRTIRVVLWTNEENGLKGAKSYGKTHADELKLHVAAIEADHGSFQPKGFRLHLEDHAASKRGVKVLAQILRLLEPIGANHASAGFSGADVRTMGAKAGVPTLGLKMDGSTYFNFHHTPADTLDKLDPAHLTDNVISFAVLAFVLADMPGRLGD